MPSTFATARYKKKDGKDGTLVFPAKKDYLYWSPNDSGNAPPTVTIPVKDITNLQATPPTGKAPALRIVLGDVNHVFHFSHGANAWQELDSMKAAVSAEISSIKEKAHPAPLAAGSGTPIRNGTAEGKSAAMAMAKAVASKADEQWYDDSKLMDDGELQQSLLKEDSALNARFAQAIRDKPESVSIMQLTTQFWRSRLHLLRAHAVNNQQKEGLYNVLPEIKFDPVPPDPDNGRPLWGKSLKINKAQIVLLFKHHPLIRVAYDNLTPKPEKPLSVDEFWTQFFQSRLLKKLKGEKILESDPRNQYLDRYLDLEAEPHRGTLLQDTRFPNWMNLEGNEQNHSQRQGNAPDRDMRPSSIDKTPVLKILNSMSEKLMAHVAPEDGEAHAPIGVDEETYDQLRLQDLAREDIDNRVVLNIRKQQQHAGGNTDDLSAEAKLYAQQDPNRVLSALQADLEPSNLGAGDHGTLKLDQAIGYHTDDESDSEDEAPSDQTNGTAPKKKKKVADRIGSHAAMTSASATILYSIKQRRKASSTDPTSLNGLSQTTFDNLTMTHNTTTEFLHYFWSVFLSGDASRAEELAQLVSTLNNSLSRINAVAATAEVERQKILDAMKEEDRVRFERTKKRRYKPSHFDRVPGGEKAIMDMVRPTVEALKKAEVVYRKAYEQQMKDVHAAAPGGA